MSQTLEQLKRQNQTLSSIGGIVRTMKTLSAINAPPYEQAAHASENFQQTVLDGFAAFAFAHGGLPSGPRKKPAHRLVVACGSDHGLCGGYHDHLARQIARHWDAFSGREQRLLCVGVQLQRALEDRNMDVAHYLMPAASVDGITRLAGEIVSWTDRYTRRFSQGDWAIELAYVQRTEQGGQQPLIVPLLPLPAHLLQAQRRWPGGSLPMLGMEAKALLAALVRHFVFGRVFRALAEALATENAARLALMQQAERSVDERLGDLNQAINTHRQDEITNELMDVMMGFEQFHGAADRTGSGQ